jgi:hypothetical protein
MPTGLSKDIVFLFGGILLSFALETERTKLAGVVSSDLLSLLCLGVFAILTGGYLAFRHYHSVLSAGGGAEGSTRRASYDHLRESLSEGGNPAKLYARWLEKGLRAVEHFFGEKEPAGRPLIQHVIGLSKPAALWTAPALDRCILFAFVYPQALLILGWVMTGKAGPAETVLGLAPQNDPLPRYITMIAIAVAVFGYSKCCGILGKPASHTPRPVRWLRFALWFALLVAASLIIDHWVSHGLGAVGGSVILSSSVAGAVAGDVLVAIASGFAGAAVGILVVLHFGVFAAGIAAALGCVAVGFAQSAFGDKDSAWCRLRRRLRHSPVFWWIFLAAAITFCIGLARLLPRTQAWPVIGPILLFCGLLPALNAPFLWFSVGMTRALLWLGLERKGWWPYFYAFVDAAVAVLVIVLLIGVIVVGVQTLDLMAVKGGGAPILAVAPLLDAVIDGLRTNAFKAEYWWIYTLMLSAMIPSLLNLAIGGFSLVRGIPVLSRHLSPYLPEGHAVAPHDRNWIALVLAIQVMVGICLGLVSQFILLPWWIFGYVMPGLGFGVLQFAQRIEALDLPARLWPG